MKSYECFMKKRERAVKGSDFQSTPNSSFPVKCMQLTSGDSGDSLFLHRRW